MSADLLRDTRTGTSFDCLGTLDNSGAELRYKRTTLLTGLKALEKE